MTATVRPRTLSALGRLKEAREELLRAVQLDPAPTEPYLGLATVEGRLGRLADARAHVDAFRQRSPEDPAGRELTRTLDELHVLAVRQGRGFAGGAGDDEVLGAFANVKVDDSREVAIVDAAVGVHRRDDRNHAAGQHREPRSEKGRR